MKHYLLDTFNYNDWANQQVIKAIESLPEKEHALKLMSHLVSAQNKWYNRVSKESDDTGLHGLEKNIPSAKLQVNGRKV